MILYLDPWSGLSGDMLLSALLDLDREDGRLETVLRRAVASLGLEEDLVEVVRDVEWGIACTRVRVKDEQAAPLRHLADMERIIAVSGLSEWVRANASGAVRRLAEVEAAVHACAVDEIHFHEVGAVDTVVDVVGAFVLVEALGVDRVMVGTIPVGGGTVEIAHGRMGVPAPATARLLEGFQIVGGPEMVELTTPTGALLVSRLEAQQGPLPDMIVERTGYGAGSLKLEGGPNVLRALLGRPSEPVDHRRSTASAEAGFDEVVELQTNLDDVSPEIVGHTVTALRAAGALEVWSVAAQMKKDRPGVVVHALVPAEREQDILAVLFAESGTLGVRRQTVSRLLATRGMMEVVVDGASVRVKWGRWRGRLVSIAPEYDDAVAASQVTGLPVKDVMRAALRAAEARLDPGAGG